MRGVPLANLDDMLAYNKEHTKVENQDSLFGAAGVNDMPSLRLKPSAPATPSDKLKWEKELLGLFISGHPLDKFKEAMDKRNTDINRFKSELKEGMTGVVAGIIEEHKEVRTKKGELMYFAKIADLTGSIEAVFFPKICEQFKQFIIIDSCVAIKGKLSLRNGTHSIVADAVKAL